MAIKPRPCAICGTVYQPRSWNSQSSVGLCSERCKAEKRDLQRKRVTLPCTTCSTPVVLTGRSLEQARRGRAYCSDACRDAWVRKDAAERMAATNRKHASARMTSRNPMRKEEHRRTQTAAMRAGGWKPKVRGGNGRGLTEPQRLLAEALGWPTEVVVVTGARATGRDDIPNSYKIDVANEETKIAVEVDGASHRTLAGQDQDRRKTAFLEGLGWTVLRFWNSEVLKDLDACVQTVRSTTSRSSTTTTTS